MTAEVKYPHVEVELIGEDGNAVAVLGRVRRALQRAWVSPDEIREYMTEATAGTYDELLQVMMRTVTVL